jgi:hypothetical protein
MSPQPIELKSASKEQLRQDLYEVAKHYVDQLLAGLSDIGYNQRVMTETAWMCDDKNLPQSFSLHFLLLDNMANPLDDTPVGEQVG